MNLPNRLTVARMVLIPVMVALMYPNTPVCNTLATIVFALAAFTDFLDGYIARKQGIVTDLGKFLDPVSDKLLTLSAFIMLIQHGLMLAWVTVVILARELCVDGLRMIAVTKGKVIAAGNLGKLKTVFQMSSTVALMLLVPVAGSPLLGHFGVVLANILMYIAVALTIVSGAEYIIKNFDCISDM